ncbi:hypothetical protein DJ83_11130 [Halorubrum ezzemoulense]|uniref:SWIM-type domain-containing protein n=1 Tax=Halorubrum ezzemoulense TaxID=337243 RepID=A0A256ITG2_HALEZ|nr:hypothetical protein [Halorubrum ezzemoulense]OYR59838.1 hypothetical protein DJ83_11130 [Halorubrum ezzemoulense]
MIDRLNFGQLREAHPDRYQKVDLLEASVVDVDDAPERFVVRREPGADSHVVELVEALGHPWGSCSCDGYAYHDGPCSHLSAVWRAELEGMLEIPTARPTAVAVDIHDEQQELADAVDAGRVTNEVATDGGRR